MAIVGGSAAAAVAVGAVAVVAARDDPRPAPHAVATTTIVPVATAAAPVVVPATRPANTSPANTAPPVVTEPATTGAPTTEAPTTTVAALPSGAGDYSVTIGEITISGGGFSTSAPGDTQIWSFTGPCDGVGDCSISAAGEAVLTTGAVGSIFSGPGSQIGLVAAGNSSYTSTFEIPAAECGSATGNITITVSNGTVGGTYTVAFAGAADCPLVSLSATFSGTRG
jgi:hypothetical protein